MKNIEKVAYTIKLLAFMIVGTLLVSASISVGVSLFSYVVDGPFEDNTEPDMGGLCMSLCKREYGKHITKAIPVDGKGCYCYP